MVSLDNKECCLERRAVMAKQIVIACCVVEWLDRNPEQSPPGRCLRCGESEQAHDELLPFRTEASGHSWLHSRCWPAWHPARKAISQHVGAANAIPPKALIRKLQKASEYLIE
jgi:hypothetical protein